ncbi:MAG: orotate phosphoribosyltransferase [Clostridiales bacterium]|nr:orotate phosphoribosyltransferase [Clostridiales bacterium]
MEDRIVKSLFETEAVRVSDPESPFWYTSGRLGPFYVNTHFLLSNEIEASELLTLIETASNSDRLSSPKLILDHMLSVYNRSESYRTVIDMITEKASKLSFDFISGGERRDFFFSMLPAYFLKKPHMSIYKDFQAVYSSDGFKSCVHSLEIDLSGKKALHIADLVTEASSYTRVWIPVIRECSAQIFDTIAVIDRQQGGGDTLLAEGVTLHTLTQINPAFFQKALENKIISEKQYNMVIDFMKSPSDYMDAFLNSHPSFIAGQIALGGKAKERAELAISKGYAQPADCDK